MTEPKIAKTWEECARHVDAGGVVQWYYDDMWMDDGLTADTYQTMADAPGEDEWQSSRRLLPIEAPEPEPSASDVPEGCEIVYIPTETIDFMHRSWCESTDDGSKWRPLDFAIRDAVARRPGEKVHWFEAFGRKDMNGNLITKVTKEDLDRPQVLYYSNNAWHRVSGDGLVEVRKGRERE